VDKRTAWRSPDQARNLSCGRDMRSRRLSRDHPSTFWISTGQPSACSFSGERRGWRGIGSASPAWGRLVTWMARGTACRQSFRFWGVSRKVRTRSSMKLSTREVDETGIPTARGLARTKGTLSLSTSGLGVDPWAGLQRVAASQPEQSMSLLERSVTISEKEHQVGGFGDPPNVRRRARYATLPRTIIDCTAAEAEWCIRQYASE
jgi:hypothetical protein